MVAAHAPTVGALVVAAAVIFVVIEAVELPDTLRKFRVVFAYIGRRRRRAKLTRLLRALEETLPYTQHDREAAVLRARVTDLRVAVKDAAFDDVASAAAIVTGRSRP